MRRPEPGAAVVTVLEGEAAVESGGRETRIAAGRTATFREGGEPADVADVEKRWQQRTGGDGQL